MKPLYQFALTIALFYCCYNEALSQKASQAPAQTTFNLSPDNLKALQNSVNLITGQVTFPMELASLPGRGGLNISVAIQYNSTGINKNMTVENLYSPTGTLGLGWSMDIPKIVADNKQTGTRQDDDFYFVENGVSNFLICKGFNELVGKFVTKNFTAWKIEYYPGSEKWIVTRENGVKYTYTPVQWMVKWGNWIGNSAQTENQSRSAYVWAISEIENIWGDKLTFQYNLSEEQVGSGGLNHTKSFYLSKITDAIGQSVEFNYQTKTSDEYTDPHNEQSEPDAYQEKYETLYLSGLNIRSAKNTLLYAVDIGYELIGNAQLSKRYLKSIQKRFPSGDTQPATQFDYFTTGQFNGYLKTVKNSLGAHIDYYFKNTSVAGSERMITVPSPSTGSDRYGDPKTYVAGDYVVISWRRLGANGRTDEGPQPVKLQAFYWDGKWSLDNNFNLLEVPNISQADYVNADIAMSSRHFIYRLFSSRDSKYTVHLARRKTHAAANEIWENKTLNFNKLGSGNAYILGKVFAGEDFVGFLHRFSETIEIETWKDEKWSSQSIAINDVRHESFFTTGVNFIFVHNDAGGTPDQLHLYYLNAEKEWQESKVPSALAFDTEGELTHDSFWHASNSFVFGLPQYNPEYIYMWDENYGNFIKKNIIGEVEDKSLVYISNAGQIGLTQTDIHLGVTVRYDGKDWHKQITRYRTENEISYGEDYVLMSYKSPSGSSCKGNFFNPNTLVWAEQIFGTLQYQNLNSKYGNAVQAGIDMVMANERFFTRHTNDQWAYGDRIPMGLTEYLVGRSAIVLSHNYVVYAYSETKSGEVDGVYIVYLENNRVKGYHRVPGCTVEPDKTNAGLYVLALKQKGQQGFAGVQLCRITDQQYSGEQLSVLVKSTIWSDGNHTFETTYDYENGLMGAGGIPYFNVVHTVSGGDFADRPYGLTQYYFYNGLPENRLLENPAIVHEGKENLLVGLPYCVVSKNKDRVEVSRTRNHYKISSQPVTNGSNNVIDIAYAVRSIKTDQMVDFILTSVENTYDETTGLLKFTKRSNSSGSGSLEFSITYNTYWWEAYDPERTRNFLSPVIQVKTMTQRAGVAGSDEAMTSVATKWSHNAQSDKYFPVMSYTWQHTGSPDFTAWHNSDTPSGDWLLISKVNKLDEADGTVFETEQNDGSQSSLLLDESHTRLIAQASYSGVDQIAYSSFEDYAQGNWSYSNDLITSSSALAGSKSLMASGSNAYINKTLAAGTYEVSFWSKNAMAVTEIENGSIVQTSQGGVLKGWTLTITTVNIPLGNGVVKLRVPATGLIDEIRIRPQGSEMITYVYDEVGNVVAQTGTNLQLTIFEYDAQYRLVIVRDHKNRIRKKNTYHFRNQ